MYSQFLWYIVQIWNTSWLDVWLFFKYTFCIKYIYFLIQPC